MQRINRYTVGKFFQYRGIQILKTRVKFLHLELPFTMVLNTANTPP